LRLFESLEDSEPRCTKALLFQIARNLIIDLRRSARHRWLRLTGNVEDLDCVTFLDPERQLIAGEDLQRFVTAIERLPTRRREAFLLRRIEDESLKTIAHSMKITVPAVEQHLTQALRTLREACAETTA
jgi:RNA polymerase sigma factor (sigma-70 family)